MYFSHLLINNQNINNIVGLKFFNVYGKNESHKGKMASVISKLIPQIKKDKEVELYKYYFNNVYCEAKRDFIYSGDVCRIISLLIEMDLKPDIYNVGTGKEIKFSELIIKAYENLNLISKIKFVDLPEKYHNKYQMFTKASTKKLLGLLDILHLQITKKPLKIFYENSNIRRFYN